VPLELADLAGGSSANVDTFEDEFYRSLPTHADSDDSKILDGDGLLDATNQTPTPSRILFNNDIEETPPNLRVAVNEAAAALTNLASFPSNYGTLENRFTNQDDEQTLRDTTPRETSLTLLMQRSMTTRKYTAKSALGTRAGGVGRQRRRWNRRRKRRSWMC